MLPPTPTPTEPESAGAQAADAAHGAVPAGARCAVHPDRHALAVCTRCGSFACVTCSHVLASGETVCATCEEKAPGTLPWEQRGRIGIARALGQTIVGVLLRPGTFFAQRPRERALWPTLLLGLGLHMLGQLGSTIADLAFIEQTRAELRQTPFAELPWLASEEFFLAQFALSPLIFLLGTYLSAALWWIGLRAVGGLQRPFHVIVRALCYAQALSVLAVIIAPIAHLGPTGEGIAFAFAIWATGLQIVGVSRMQGIEVARGALAFLVVAALMGSLLCLAGTAALWGIASKIPIPAGL